MSDKNRTVEIKRLYSIGWPIVAIAHQLKCSEQLVGYHLDERSGTKAKVGAKPKMNSGYIHLYRKVGRDLTQEEIDQIFGEEKFEDKRLR